MVINPDNVSTDQAYRPPVQVNQWCARFEVECRRRRLRVTVQRLAVYRALAADAAHPTAEALYARLRTGMTGLSLATVYRILESFEREGFVHRLSSQDGVARFDANLAHHQHLVCRSCGRITDLAEESLAEMKLPKRGLAQFIPEIFDIRIIGICAPCRRAGGGRLRYRSQMSPRRQAPDL